MATGDKLMTAAEIKAVTDTKLDKASYDNALASIGLYVDNGAFYIIEEED